MSNISLMSKLIITIFAASTSTMIIAGALLFYPLFNFKSFIKGDKNPNSVFVINSYNPFKPKVSEIVKLNDENAYFVTVTDYERTGLFEFTWLNSLDGKNKPIDFNGVDAKIPNKSLEGVKDIATKQDLSNGTYSPEKSEYQKIEELEQKKPAKCQAVFQYQDQINDRPVSTFKLIKKSQSFAEIKKLIPEKGVGEISLNYVYNVKIQDPGNVAYI